MPSSGRNRTLDETAFEGSLSSAFVIQDQNDQRNRTRKAPAESESERVGQRGDAPHCESSGVDQLRPGERLQHNWASMWLMSQERGLWPERSAEVAEKPIAQETNDAADEPGERGLGDSGFHDPLIIKPAFNRPALNRPALDRKSTEGRRTTEAIVKALAPVDLKREDADPAGEPFALSASDEFSPDVDRKST